MNKEFQMGGLAQPILSRPIFRLWVFIARTLAVTTTKPPVLQHISPPKQAAKKASKERFLKLINAGKPSLPNTPQKISTNSAENIIRRLHEDDTETSTNDDD